VVIGADRNPGVFPSPDKSSASLFLIRVRCILPIGMQSDQTILQYDQPSTDMLVGQRAPFKRFLPHFSSRRQAAQFFATAYGQVYAPANAVGSCAVCGREAAAAAARYGYEARFFKGLGFGWFQLAMLAAGWIGVRVDSYVVTLIAYHPICRHCKSRMRRRLWLANLLNFVGLFVMLVAGTATVGLYCQMIYDRASAGPRAELYLFIATGLTLIGGLCLCCMKPLRVPKRFRFLARRPIYFRSAKVIGG
jgi:hypothetical protein